MEQLGEGCLLLVESRLRKFRKAYGIDYAPVDCFRLLRGLENSGSLDISWETTNAVPGHFDAVTYYFPGEDCYLIISRSPPESWRKVSAWRRVNFTMAHELGHIALGHLRVNEDLKTSQTKALEDREADAFAARLLMPESVMGFFRSVSEAADSLLVSGSAVRFRIRELGISYAEKRCPECGFQVPPAARFCRRCGEQLLPGPNPEDPPEIRFLPILGKKCPVCGADAYRETCETCGISRRNFCNPEYNQPRHSCPPDARYCEVCHAETEFLYWKETLPRLERKRMGIPD